MSYDLYFVKSKKLTLENVDEFLADDASESDEHFISKALMKEIRETLENNGLSFKTCEGEAGDSWELNFETYQVSMFHSQIAISLPYWDINSSDTIGNEVKLISKGLFEKGFTGCDPQTSKFYTDLAAFSTEVNQINEQVNEHFAPAGTNRESRKAWRLIKLGIVFALVVLLIRFLASLIG